MSRSLASQVALLATLCWLVVASPARAQDFFSSSPGPLSSNHAQWDDPAQCNECHDGGRTVVSTKCTGCHDHSNLARRLEAGKGLHASAVVRGKACETCHTEHKGRGKDIMGWTSLPGGEKGFDHELAGWRLGGKHATLSCENCHKDKNRQGARTYLGNDRLCGACHKDDQPHKFEKKALLACDRCHTESVWKPGKGNPDFDHDDENDAAMPLVGAHVDVSCAKCHPKSLFNLPVEPAGSCGNSGCHTSPHGKHLFDKVACAKCHSPKLGALTKINFDHDRQTKFSLGAHKKLDCYRCHTKALGAQKPNGSCEQGGCHANDNKHGTRFAEFGTPPKCVTCHTSGASWRTSVFDHNQQTKFTLTAAHAEVNCRKCHRGNGPAEFEKFDPKTVGCMGCHQHAAVHDKQWTDAQCKNCHKPGEINVNRDQARKTFHGPDSSFPLVRGHKNVSCGKCHKDVVSGKTVFANTPAECGAECHEDSLHKGTLGPTCSRCHSSGQWDPIRFDHDEDSSFKLVGLHRKVPECEDCHPKHRYKDTPTTCGVAGCHLEDDGHRGALGTSCARCHVETGENRFDHNTMARFALTGKHTQAACGDCHPSVTFKPRPATCVGCHPEPTVHKGMYGTDCAKCHTPENFAAAKALHDVGDFSLGGAHKQVDCVRCHKDNRPLAGSGNFCAQCHRQGDIHSNSLSPRCGECHTQLSFAPARFDHMRVGCALRGVHRTLPCADCHKQGNYGATLSNCASCHRDEAIARQTHADRLTVCGSCHRADTWTSGAAGAGSGDSICQ